MSVPSSTTRVVASVDVGKVNMAVCVARIRACRPDSAYLAQELAIAPTRPVLGDLYPDAHAIHRQYPPMDVEWEGVHYAVRIVRWGVYSLRSDGAQAAYEERTGRKYVVAKCKKGTTDGTDGGEHGTGDAQRRDETLETLVPQLITRATEWLRIWARLGVTDVCIEQQVAMGGGGAPAGRGGAMFGSSMAGNVTAKVLSHVLQCMCMIKAQRMSRPWHVHFMSPRLTNAIADHIRGEKRPARGVSKHDKKKYAVQAVEQLMTRHDPPLSGIFMRATKSKRDDLSDALLQAIRFVRDADGLELRKHMRKHALHRTTAAGAATSKKRRRVLDEEEDKEGEEDGGEDGGR